MSLTSDKLLATLALYCAGAYLRLVAGIIGWHAEFFTNYTKMPIVAFLSLLCENKRNPLIKCYP